MTAPPYSHGSLYWHGPHIYSSVDNVKDGRTVDAISTHISSDPSNDNSKRSPTFSISSRSDDMLSRSCKQGATSSTSPRHSIDSTWHITTLCWPVEELKLRRLCFLTTTWAGSSPHGSFLLLHNLRRHVPTLPVAPSPARSPSSCRQRRVINCHLTTCFPSYLLHAIFFLFLLHRLAPSRQDQALARCLPDRSHRGCLTGVLGVRLPEAARSALLRCRISFQYLPRLPMRLSQQTTRQWQSRRSRVWSWYKPFSTLA
jgi:hypothetical protein